MYKESMSILRKGPVLSGEEFETLHTTSKSKTIQLFEQLLFGLSQVYEPGLKELQTQIDEFYLIFQSENNKLIESQCKRVSNDQLRIFEEALTMLSLPIASSELSQTVKEQLAKVKHNYQDTLQKFETTAIYKDVLSSLETTLNGVSCSNHVINSLYERYMPTIKFLIEICLTSV
jgi:hypothetical protein